MTQFFLLRNLKSKWCLSSVPLQLSLYQMTAGHRYPGKTCSYCSDLQRNFSLFRSACSPCLPFHLLLGQQMSHCFCELFLPFPASLKWKEWEKQMRSKAKIKWLQRRESLWTHNNHCRRGGTWTGSKALSSSAELLSKQGTPTEVPFTLPHVTSLYTRTQSSLTAISLCLLFHKKLYAPKFWLLQLLLDLHSDYSPQSLISATPGFLNVMQNTLWKQTVKFQVSSSFISFHSSVLTTDATESCSKTQTSSFP